MEMGEPPDFIKRMLGIGGNDFVNLRYATDSESMLLDKAADFQEKAKKLNAEANTLIEAANVEIKMNTKIHDRPLRICLEKKTKKWIIEVMKEPEKEE